MERDWHRWHECVSHRLPDANAEVSGKSNGVRVTTRADPCCGSDADSNLVFCVMSSTAARRRMVKNEDRHDGFPCRFLICRTRAPARMPHERPGAQPSRPQSPGSAPGDGRGPRPRSKHPFHPPRLASRAPIGGEARVDPVMQRTSARPAKAPTQRPHHQHEHDREQHHPGDAPDLMAGPANAPVPAPEPHGTRPCKASHGERHRARTRRDRPWPMPAPCPQHEKQRQSRHRRHREIAPVPGVLAESKSRPHGLGPGFNRDRARTPGARARAGVTVAAPGSRSQDGPSPC